MIEFIVAWMVCWEVKCRPDSFGLSVCTIPPPRDCAWKEETFESRSDALVYIQENFREPSGGNRGPKLYERSEIPLSAEVREREIEIPATTETERWLEWEVGG